MAMDASLNYNDRCAWWVDTSFRGKSTQTTKYRTDWKVQQCLLFTLCVEVWLPALFHTGIRSTGGVGLPDTVISKIDVYVFAIANFRATVVDGFPRHF